MAQPKKYSQGPVIETNEADGGYLCGECSIMYKQVDYFVHLKLISHVR